MQTLTPHQLETLTEALDESRDFIGAYAESNDPDFIEQLQHVNVKIKDSLVILRILQSNANIPELKKDLSVEVIGPGPVDLGEFLAPILASLSTPEETKQQIRDLIENVKHTI